MSILMTEYDYATDMAVLKEESYEDGLFVGLATGREEGREEGISIGLEHGLAQGAYEKSILVGFLLQYCHVGGVVVFSHQNAQNLTSLPFKIVTQDVAAH